METRAAYNDCLFKTFISSIGMLHIDSKVLRVIGILCIFNTLNIETEEYIFSNIDFNIEHFFSQNTAHHSRIGEL